MVERVRIILILLSKLAIITLLNIIRKNILCR